MKTVYTQDDALDLKRLGKPFRPRELVYVTALSEGSQVEVEGSSSPTGDVVAVASNGTKVWPLTQNDLNLLQKTKRPHATHTGEVLLKKKDSKK